MNYDDDDALDAALFALPLEEPPVNLRTSILSATIYRPAPLFSMREMIVLGSFAAVTLWLVAAIVLGGATLFVQSLQTAQYGLGHALENGPTLAWIAAGGATAIWLSIFTGFQPPTKVKAPQQS